MVKIKKQLVSQDVINKRSYGHGNPCNYIIVHQTGNTSKGANAQAHANLQSNLNPRQASWHYTVSNTDVIQSFDDSVRCWATNDGRTANGGNMTGLQVELCINSDGNYKQTVKTGAKLVAYLMKEHNLTIDKVKQHADFFNKNCPAQIRAGKEGITWDKFIDMVEGKEPSNKPNTKPQTPSNTSNKVKPNYNTKSIVTFLASINQPFSFNHRKKLASYYNVGTGKYTGSAVQNLQLLDAVKKDYKKNGKLRTKPASNKTQGKSKSSSKPSTSSNKSYKKGNKVKIKTSAKNYSRTTTAIPSRHKNKTYTIQQVAKDDVLIKELYSWVKKSDLVGSSSNNKTSKSKSISQMATEVIQGKHGNGHANRRKSLGISQAEYNKVRAEVNRRL